MRRNKKSPTHHWSQGASIPYTHTLKAILLTSRTVPSVLLLHTSAPPSLLPAPPLCHTHTHPDRHIATSLILCPRLPSPVLPLPCPFPASSSVAAAPLLSPACLPWAAGFRSLAKFRYTVYLCVENFLHRSFTGLTFVNWQLCGKS